MFLGNKLSRVLLRNYFPILIFVAVTFLIVQSRKKESVIMAESEDRTSRGNDASQKKISDRKVWFEQRLKTYRNRYEGEIGCRNTTPLSKEEERRYKELVQVLNEMNRQLIPYPDKAYRGRGIVLSVGSPQINFARLNLKIMEKLSIELPVQIWFSESESKSETMLSEFVKPFPKLNLSVCSYESAECVSQHEKMQLSKENVHPPKGALGHWKHFPYKPAAIVSSTFREVLFLDCDSYVVRDPTALFDDPMYKEFGALFYPDAYRTRQNPYLWGLLNSACAIEEYEFDSSMILVNKEQSWKGIFMSKLINDKTEFFYDFVTNGDKDSFKIAFRFVQTPYYLVSIPCSSGRFDGKYFCGYTLCKTDSFGQFIFVNHIHLLKYENIQYSKTTLGYTRIGLCDPNNLTIYMQHCPPRRFQSSCFHLGDLPEEKTTENYCNYENLRSDEAKIHKQKNNKPLVTSHSRMNRVIISKTNDLTSNFLDLFLSFKPNTLIG